MVRTWAVCRVVGVIGRRKVHIGERSWCGRSGDRWKSVRKTGKDDTSQPHGRFTYYRVVVFSWTTRECENFSCRRAKTASPTCSKMCFELPTIADSAIAAMRVMLVAPSKLRWNRENWINGVLSVSRNSKRNRPITHDHWRNVVSANAGLGGCTNRSWPTNVAGANSREHCQDSGLARRASVRAVRKSVG